MQAAALGVVVLIALAAGGVGLARVAARQGLWADTVEVTVGFPEVHDVSPGTPVRIRGVDAGQVVAIEYPDHDGDGANVTLRLRVEGKYAGRLYADAAAQIHSTGLLGAKVIAVTPGTPAAGPLQDGRLRATEAPDLAQAAAKLGAAAGKIGDVADEAKQFVKDVRGGNGTLGRLVKDDDLYQDIKGLTTDARQMVRRGDQALGKVDGKVQDVQRFVDDGRETLRSVRQGTDAIQRMPIIRGYVEDATAALVRPSCRREAVTYSTADIFEPGTAILTDAGRDHLAFVVNWLKGVQNDKAELAVAAVCDPNDPSQTAASAAELTRKQSEAVTEYLKARGVYKIGWWSRRKVATVGLGFGPSPVVEKQPVPPSYVQVVLFTPQS
ncbi:ABC-type transport system, periplasmic component [Fimbriiglobus ruber]|uniref:ABC-type transport system, periplasmic component n=1 Tax=Fimbriiglobus ruber TaxID=1908690 RepID=A0A225E1N2_9BACT|nr:ABC-type transport system, periplasmic component [Fimbriiglobus ruber]